MPREYDDPLNPESLDAAAARAIELSLASPEVPLDRHLERAVHEHVCACAVAIEDQIEGGRDRKSVV